MKKPIEQTQRGFRLVPSALAPRYRTVEDALGERNPVFRYHKVGDTIVVNPEYDACQFEEVIFHNPNTPL